MNPVSDIAGAARPLRADAQYAVCPGGVFAGMVPFAYEALPVGPAVPQPPQLRQRYLPAVTHHHHWLAGPPMPATVTANAQVFAPPPPPPPPLQSGPGTAAGPVYVGYTAPYVWGPAPLVHVPAGCAPAPMITYHHHHSHAPPFPAANAVPQPLQAQVPQPEAAGYVDGQPACVSAGCCPSGDARDGDLLGQQPRRQRVDATQPMHPPPYPDADSTSGVAVFAEGFAHRRRLSPRRSRSPMKDRDRGAGAVGGRGGSRSPRREPAVNRAGARILSACGPSCCPPDREGGRFRYDLDDIEEIIETDTRPRPGGGFTPPFAAGGVTDPTLAPLYEFGVPAPMPSPRASELFRRRAEDRQHRRDIRADRREDPQSLCTHGQGAPTIAAAADYTQVADHVDALMRVAYACAASEQTGDAAKVQPCPEAGGSVGAQAGRPDEQIPRAQAYRREGQAQLVSGGQVQTSLPYQAESRQTASGQAPSSEQVMRPFPRAHEYASGDTNRAQAHSYSVERQSPDEVHHLQISPEPLGRQQHDQSRRERLRRQLQEKIQERIHRKIAEALGAASHLQPGCSGQRDQYACQQGTVARPSGEDVHHRSEQTSAVAQQEQGSQVVVSQQVGDVGSGGQGAERRSRAPVQKLQYQYACHPGAVDVAGDVQGVPQFENLTFLQLLTGEVPIPALSPCASVANADSVEPPCEQAPTGPPAPVQKPAGAQDGGQRATCHAECRQSPGPAPSDARPSAEAVLTATWAPSSLGPGSQMWPVSTAEAADASGVDYPGIGDALEKTAPPAPSGVSVMTWQVPAMISAAGPPKPKRRRTPRRRDHYHLPRGASGGSPCGSFPAPAGGAGAGTPCHPGVGAVAHSSGATGQAAPKTGGPRSKSRSKSPRGTSAPGGGRRDGGVADGRVRTPRPAHRRSRPRPSPTLPCGVGACSGAPGSAPSVLPCGEEEAETQEGSAEGAPSRPSGEKVWGEPRGESAGAAPVGADGGAEAAGTPGRDVPSASGTESTITGVPAVPAGPAGGEPSEALAAAETGLGSDGIRPSEADAVDGRVEPDAGVGGDDRDEDASGNGHAADPAAAAGVATKTRRRRCGKRYRETRSDRAARYAREKAARAARYARDKAARAAAKAAAALQAAQAIQAAETDDEDASDGGDWPGGGAAPTASPAGARLAAAEETRVGGGGGGGGGPDRRDSEDEGYGGSGRGRSARRPRAPRGVLLDPDDSTESETEVQQPRRPRRGSSATPPPSQPESGRTFQLRQRPGRAGQEPVAAGWPEPAPGAQSVRPDRGADDAVQDDRDQSSFLREGPHGALPPGGAVLRERRDGRVRTRIQTPGAQLSATQSRGQAQSPRGQDPVARSTRRSVRSVGDAAGREPVTSPGLPATARASPEASKTCSAPCADGGAGDGSDSDGCALSELRARWRRERGAAVGTTVVAGELGKAAIEPRQHGLDRAEGERPGAGPAEAAEDGGEGVDEEHMRGADDVGAEMDVVTEGEEPLGAGRERTSWMAALQGDGRWWEVE
uniref:Protein m18 n=1 Tax=Mastomys natalensis cytomegalovirus 2 TaxID=2973540 RepID=A0A9Y1IMA7_9BETA|nr:protein m18 [Mastomys natalensis cytomegalovirus 2]WEG69576.1 protein m18 [Mastomys natalensis cytomegalovirus 2]